MAFITALLLVIAGGTIAVWVLRRRALPAELPPTWQALLRARLPHYLRLAPELRQRFDHKLRRFLDEKRFYGCNDLQVTEEMRVLIAGMACLLILRPGAPVYPQLRSILVYPTAFWVRHQEPDEIGLVYNDEVLQVGESQDWGRVVLSWEDIESALAGDEVNVAVHEFAHQLDDGQGAPRLEDYRRWSRIMQKAYDELCERGSPVLDDYGTEGPAEFFAVASEAYFQRGAELRRHHPELYRLLRDYYLLDTCD